MMPHEFAFSAEKPESIKGKGSSMQVETFSLLASQGIYRSFVLEILISVLCCGQFGIAEF